MASMVELCSVCADADEDMRRAMNKSYQESNGTALSTNWKEIAKNKSKYEHAVLCC